MNIDRAPAIKNSSMPRLILYSKFSKGELFYTGTEISDKCDMSKLDNYGVLMNDFTEMIKVLNPKEETKKE